MAPSCGGKAEKTASAYDAAGAGGRGKALQSEKMCPAPCPRKGEINLILQDQLLQPAAARRDPDHAQVNIKVHVVRTLDLRGEKKKIGHEQKKSSENWVPCNQPRSR